MSMHNQYGRGVTTSFIIALQATILVLVTAGAGVGAAMLIGGF